VSGRCFFEEIIRENIDLGRPEQMQLIFSRKMNKSTEDQALELLIQATGGLPRAINHLAQRAIEAAAAAAAATINAAHVHAALDRLQWLNSPAA
jgi:Holliday junction resolvasome RuvABC ATP-dependent DNA helicase subunit